MKIEETIIDILSTSGQGMWMDRKLFTRWDNAPVDRKMVYAVVVSHPDTFVQAEGQIMLII